jgi:hypothetical protein
MKRSSNFVSTLLGLMLLVALGIGLAAVLRGASSATSGPGVSPLATAVVLQSPLNTPTSVNIPSPVNTPSLVPTATPMVIPPPPNWPTDQPWPPPPSTPNILPTQTLRPIPMPKLSPIPQGPLPSDIKSLVFVSWGNSLVLESVKIGSDGTRWSNPEQNAALALPANQFPQSLPPDYSVGISGIHPTTKGNKVALDIFVYEHVQLWIADIISGASISVTLPDQKNVQLISFTDWAPDGSELIAYYSNRENGYIAVDTKTGVSRKLNFPQNGLGNTLVQDVRYSPDGNTLTYVINTTTREQTKGAIFISSKDGTNPQLLHESLGVTIAGGSLNWSPDGQYLIYATTVHPFNDLAPGDIRILGMDGNERVLVTQIPAFYTKPAWSPDGRWIVFVKAGSLSNNDLGPTEIALIDVNTSKVESLATPSNRRNLSPKWSPNSRLISFSSTSNYSSEIWLVDISTRQSYPVAGPAKPVTPLSWMP